MREERRALRAWRAGPLGQAKTIGTNPPRVDTRSQSPSALPPLVQILLLTLLAFAAMLLLAFLGDWLIGS